VVAPIAVARPANTIGTIAARSKAPTVPADPVAFPDDDLDGLDFDGDDRGDIDGVAAEPDADADFDSDG
jgi:hypothetical protein